MSDEHTEIERTVGKRQAARVAAHAWRPQERCSSIGSDMSTPTTERRTSGPQERQVAAGAGPDVQRARRRTGAPADRRDNLLLRHHQRIVRPRRIGVGPQRIPLARRQRQRPFQDPTSSASSRTGIRTPSFPAADSESARCSARSSYGAAYMRSAYRQALTARSSARRAGVSRRSVTVG